MKLDLEEVRRLIREMEDPEELQQKLKGMIEEAHPVVLFTDGETVEMHVFEGRFKQYVCQGNEALYLQWPVQVFVAEDGFHLWLKVGESE